MFKAITVLEIPQDVRTQVLNALRNSEELLSNYKFVSPAANEKSRMGFSHTQIGTETFVSVVDNNIILKVTTQSKTLNPNEIDAVFRIKCEKYKVEENMESVPKAVAKVFKEDAELSVMASTFPAKAKPHYIVFRPDGKVLVEGKGAVAENSMSLIRKVLGSLPVLPVELDGDMHDLLKTWIKTDLNDKLMLGEKATVISAPTGGAEGIEHKVKGRIGTDRKVLGILKEDLAVATEVQVEYDSVMQLTINSEFVLSSIKYAKDLTADEEDKAAGLIIQMHETNHLVDHVLQLLTDHK